MMHSTAILPSTRTIKDIAVLVWFSLLPCALYLTGGAGTIFQAIPADVTMLDAISTVMLINSLPACFLITAAHHFDQRERIAAFCLLSLLTIMAHAGNDFAADESARLRFLLAPVYVTLVTAFCLLLWTRGLEFFEHRYKKPL